jgi:hypothetical protein
MSVVLDLNVSINLKDNVMATKYKLYLISYSKVDQELTNADRIILPKVYKTREDANADSNRVSFLFAADHDATLEYDEYITETTTIGELYEIHLYIAIEGEV